MKAIYLLIITLIMFSSGVLIAKNHYEEPKGKITTAEFLQWGQFQPEYIAFDDIQMLQECEHFYLSYDYESGECVETPNVD